MENILDLLGVAGPALTGVVFGGAVLAIFWKGDDAISQQARQALSSWLQRAQMPDSPPNWPDNFISIFDRIFGEKHISWRCFGMSSLVSFVALAIMTIGFLALTFPKLLLSSDITDVSIFFAVLLYFGAALNLVPDYISLLVTRHILDKVQSASSQTIVISWLVVDGIATTLIFLVPFRVLGPLVTGALTDGSVSWEFSWEVWLDSLRRLIAFEGTTSAFFYTTFFTSFWIWIYVAARATVRGLTASGPALRFLRWALPIRSKPIRSIGEVAAVLCCVGSWIFAWIVSGQPAAVSPPAAP